MSLEYLINLGLKASLIDSLSDPQKKIILKWINYINFFENEKKSEIIEILSYGLENKAPATFLKHGPAWLKKDKEEKSNKYKELLSKAIINKAFGSCYVHGHHFKDLRLLELAITKSVPDEFYVININTELNDSIKYAIENNYWRIDLIKNLDPEQTKKFIEDSLNIQKRPRNKREYEVSATNLL